MHVLGKLVNLRVEKGELLGLQFADPPHFVQEGRPCRPIFRNFQEGVAQAFAPLELEKLHKLIILDAKDLLMPGGALAGALRKQLFELLVTRRRRGGLHVEQPFGSRVAFVGVVVVIGLPVGDYHEVDARDCTDRFVAAAVDYGESAEVVEVEVSGAARTRQHEEAEVRHCYADGDMGKVFLNPVGTHRTILRSTKRNRVRPKWTSMPRPTIAQEIY